MLTSRIGICSKSCWNFTKYIAPCAQKRKSFPYCISLANHRLFLRDNCGVTLLELIIALFVISIVTALVMPSFTNFGERKLKSEVRELASLLRHMNDSAVAHKKTFFIRFDLDKGMVSWTGPDGEREKIFNYITGVTTQSRGRVSKGELTFFFDPLGTRENISVHMSDGDNDMTITLYHLSGRVKII
jgi:prepilin-type N-terminal cleavage/methylation domain-containing protein